MTTEEFNALPLAARRWIEQEQGCASCGKSKDVDTLYKNYLLMSKKALYTLRRGAVPYKRENGEGGVLYPIHPKDSEEQIKEKLTQALEVYAVAPNRFDDIQESKIQKILGETKKAPLVGAALAAANKKAAKEAAAIAEAKAVAEAEAKAAAEGQTAVTAEAKAAKDSLD